jgi:hypothetical protein
MSGLFARTKPAGRDGVRYARSKHIGDIDDGQCNLRKLARIDRSVLPSTASCKFVGYPPSNLARGADSDQMGMAATGRLYTPPDIIKRQAMRANLLAKATATKLLSRCSNFTVLTRSWSHRQLERSAGTCMDVGVLRAPPRPCGYPDETRSALKSLRAQKGVDQVT